MVELYAYFDATSPFLVHMVLEKYEEDFFKCVNAKLRLRKLIRRGVITDTIKGDIESANDDEAREILFDHLKQNANVDTLKKYLKVAIVAEGYPKMQSLGRKMMEELEQGGWSELCAYLSLCGRKHVCVCVCVCGVWCVSMYMWEGVCVRCTCACISDTNIVQVCVIHV